MTDSEFLELLARDATPVEFEAPILAARAAGADAETLSALEQAKTLALQVRGILESRRRREAELSALYETASDLAALSDLDEVLTAIVRRARGLLQSDIAYLSLNDDERGDTYMRVTDGSISAEFRKVRLPMGAGLGGLVAQTAMPYTSASYFEDERFRHTHDIDSAVTDEGLVSILGVPLSLGTKVIGVLYAANRSVQPFTRSDTALLVSLAAHAAIAIDNARLLAETHAALGELKQTSEQLRIHTSSVERAADAHDRLTTLLVRGGGVGDVAAVVAEVLDGEVLILDPDDNELTGNRAALTEEQLDAVHAAAESSQTVVRQGLATTPVLAGTELLAVLGIRRDSALDRADRRILERGALVTALLLLFRRNVAEAEGRVRSELLTDLLTAADRDPADLRDRARLLGVDLDRDHVLLVAQITGDRDRVSQAAAHLSAGRDGFAVIHQGRLVMLLPGSDPSEVSQLVEQGMRLPLGGAMTAGVCGPVSGPAAVAPAHDEARRVLDALLALGQTGACVQAPELGFVGLLVGDEPQVGGFVSATLGPVIDYDTERGTSLVETLDAYFRSGASIVKTAAELHVHVNTVTQRLERVRVLLGDEWQQPERQLEVQLALRLHRLTG